MNMQPYLAAETVSSLKHFVSSVKLHPILVNFTAALTPVSVFSDLAGRLARKASLRDTGWWTLVFAVIVTPLTAITGWLFWMPDDNGVAEMTIHKWLGTGIAVLLFVLFAWRLQFRKKQESPSWPYLFLGAVFIAALIYQGYLGGEQVFSM